MVAGTLGAPVAAVTLGLGIIAAGGAFGLGADIGANIANGNRDGLAYDAGSVVGGALAGGFAGRSIAEGVNRVPSPPWSLKSDRGQGFNPDLGSVWDWLGTGPNPGSAAGSAASGGAGAASMAGRRCGC